MSEKLIRDELCRKLRVIAREYGQNKLKGAVMVGSLDVDHISDIPYINCPSLGTETLGNVDFKTARAFEDA